ncbi:MAG: hypothetical protein H6Q69_2298 [Firmicutes bacterium]|nr:hypothetical protein [Bacillota bacterium]
MFSKSTLKSTPIGLEAAFSIGNILTDRGTSIPSSSVIDYVNGQIIVPQNTVFTIQGIGGSDVQEFSFSVLWEEIPVNA